MSIYLGNTEIGQIYLGNTEIATAYLGSTKVYEAGSPTPPTPKPYDTEVEYIETNGTQYIDTGILASSSLVMTMDAAFLGTGGSYQNLLGSAYNSKYAFACIYNKSSKKCYIQYGSSNSSYVNLVLTNGTKHTFEIKVENGNSILKIDSTSASTANANTYSEKSLHLFANFNGNNKADARFYSLIIYDNGTKVRDFIPVRVGTTGYLYDKVSGELFGNIGTGDFILGNDKN